MNQAVDFFDGQFKRQVELAQYALNPFEAAALPHLSGRVPTFNVLIEGTTFMDMFDPASHSLWRTSEIDAAFEGWEVLYQQDADFPARDNLLKRFRTLVARKSAAGWREA